MSKRLILILALAFVVGIAFTAYAEVQNVKVSGDLNIMGVARNNLDLAKEKTTTPTTNNLITKSDTQRSVMSQIRVRIDADLTDNVATTVRLLNEKEWGDSTAANDDIDLDLAFVTMKEFLYSPLTLTVGRQELHFGNDMIVGDPDTNGLAAGSALPTNLRDLSLRKGFDAVRANLNYDPLVLDLIYAKINEGTNTINDDTTLYGVNANYMLNKETTLEGYSFAKITDSNSTKVGASNIQVTKADKVFTVGGRAVNKSVKNLALQLESAFQFGTYNPAFDANAVATAKTMQRRAWGLEAIAGYDLKDVKSISKYSPYLSAEYIYLSGDNPKQKTNDKAWHGWDAMYENQTAGHLLNAIMGFSNSHIVGLSGKMKPVDDVSLNIDYVYAWLDKAYRGADSVILGSGTSYVMTHNRNVGQELDAKLTYDYTEDVQFGLMGGVFIPGSAFEKDTAGNRSNASELIGSMKVTF